MWIISLFLLAFIVDPCLCCSCAPNHIQNAYCSSSLVIRGKAIKRPESRNIETTTVPDPWHQKKIFDVDVIEVFKAPTDADIKTGDVIEAVTPASESMCGGYLPLNKEFLIAGGVNRRGQMTFDHCSYHKPYNVLSNFQVEGLQGGYSCDCRVHTWYSYNHGKECRTNVIRGYISQCLHRYGRCVLKDNKCEWDVEPAVSCNTGPTTLPPPPATTTLPPPPATTTLPPPPATTTLPP